MAENSAPAKIWATPTRETYSAPIWDRGEFYEDERHADGFGVKYVRADYHDKLVEALTIIDALDPEEHVYGCSADALRGLVIQMGQHARAALASLQTQEEGGV